MTPRQERTLLGVDNWERSNRSPRAQGHRSLGPTRALVRLGFLFMDEKGRSYTTEKGRAEAIRIRNSYEVEDS